MRTMDEVTPIQIARLLNDTVSNDADIVRAATGSLDRLSLLPHFPFCLLSIATRGENQGQIVAAATYLKNLTRKNVNNTHASASASASASYSKLSSNHFKDQLMRAILSVEPAVLKLFVEMFRAIVVSEFVNQNNWPELVPELRSAIQSSNLFNNGAKCEYSTINALVALQALLRPFQEYMDLDIMELVTKSPRRDSTSQKKESVVKLEDEDRLIFLPDHLTQHVLSFMTIEDITQDAVLAADGLLKDIESITQKYKTLTMAHKGEVKAIVTTVIPLPAEEQKELKETLQYILGAGKKVLLEKKVKELKKKLKNEKSQAHIDENAQTAENEAAIAELRREMDEARAERL